MLKKLKIVFLATFLLNLQLVAIEAQQQCTLPANVLNGQLTVSGAPIPTARSSSRVNAGTSVTLTCNTGCNVTNGFARSICDGNGGVWFPTLGTCQCAVNPLLECGLGSGPKITGGVDAQTGEFPWMAKLQIMYQDDSTSYDCGGSLIDRQWVLTAAHCVTEKPVNTVILTFGISNSTERGATIRSQQSIHVHPYYSGLARNYDFDVALIRLNFNVTFSTRVRPICLPDALCSADSGTSRRSSSFDSCSNAADQLLAAGWGVTEDGRSSSSLKKVNLTLIARDQCQAGARLSAIHSSQFCAGTDGRGDTCQGDSGSPLMCIKQGRTYALGIVSNGPTCGQGLPGVYARVCSAIDWIRATVNGRPFSTTTSTTTTMAATTRPTSSQQCVVPNINYGSIHRYDDYDEVEIDLARGDLVELGNVIYLNCNDGFELVGSYEAVCRGGRNNWAPRIGRCTKMSTTTATTTTVRLTRPIRTIPTTLSTVPPIYCLSEDLPVLSNGDYGSALRRNPVGTRISYYCDVGYSLLGASEVSTLCLQTGFWSPLSARCILNAPPTTTSGAIAFRQPATTVRYNPSVQSCSSFEVPTVANAERSSFLPTSIGSKIFFSCRMGYTPTSDLENDLLSQCQSDGSWSIPRARCVPTTTRASNGCHVNALPPLINGVFTTLLLEDVSAVGTTMVGSCLANHQPVSGSLSDLRIQCLANYSWSVPTTRCRRVPTTTLSPGLTTTPNILSEIFADILFGLTPLHKAARAGNLEEVKRLVQNGADLFARSGNLDINNLPIHTAALFGHLAIVKYMVEQAPSLKYAGNNVSAIPLHSAAATGRQAIVAYFIDEQAMDVDTKSSQYGRTALHYACTEDSNLDMIKYLIRRGANVYAKSNIRDKEYQPIHLAARMTDIDTVRYLIDQYPNMTMAKSSEGFMPIHTAAMGGQVEIIDYFIVEKRISIESKTSPELYTPLILASSFGNLETVRYLLHKGADPYARSASEGTSAIHLAAVEDELEIVELLVHSFPNLTMLRSTKSGYLPLHFAAISEGYTVLSYLIDEKQVPVDSKTTTLGRTPLHMAAGSGELETVKLLISRGASPYATSNSLDRESRPIHLAAEFGNLPVVQYLCERYPDMVQERNGLGERPLERARFASSTDAVRFYLQLKTTGGTSSG